MDIGNRYRSPFALSLQHFIRTEMTLVKQDSIHPKRITNVTQTFSLEYFTYFLHVHPKGNAKTIYS